MWPASAHVWRCAAARCGRECRRRTDTAAIRVEERGIVRACAHPFACPNAMSLTLSTAHRRTRYTASSPRNASKSSRSFAQSGLCGAKNRPLDETRQAMCSPVWANVQRAPRRSFQLSLDARPLTHAAIKTAVKKIFCFKRVDQLPRRMCACDRRLYCDLLFARCGVGVRRDIFFCIGC